MYESYYFTTNLYIVVLKWLKLIIKGNYIRRCDNRNMPSYVKNGLYPCVI